MEPSFFQRHEFLIRRLHSLSGLVPVGAYMVVHLLTNASIAVGASTFQNAVYLIHTPGPVLWVIEWAFIFIPLLFHGIVGLALLRNMAPNNYPYVSNHRYSLQRATGVIAFLFIGWHVFHMHGWFHFEPWLSSIAEPLGGASFKPYNAASTAAAAMQTSIIVPILYTIGVLATVFHLANGIWTFGITWGLWVTPAAQQRANYISIGIGVVLSIVSMTAIGGFSTLDADKAREIEDQSYEARVQEHSIIPDEHKRSGGHEDADHKEEDSSEVSLNETPEN